MKRPLSALFIFIYSFTMAQSSGGKIPISITKSNNGRFSIKSISYDNEFPTLRGKSIIYENDKIKYTIDRSFDLVESLNFYLTISNDGSTIAYLIDETYSDNPQLNNITIYKDGKLAKNYSTEEFTNCDSCTLFYENYYKVVDLEKSKYNSPDYKKVYKDGVSQQEIFLEENAIINVNDTLYVTNSSKNVTVYDLRNQKKISVIPFKDIYNKIKIITTQKPIIQKVEPCYITINDFKLKKEPIKLSAAIAKLINLKYISVNDKDFHKYKLYRIEVTGYLTRNGKFEIETFKCDSKLDKKNIIRYINELEFESSIVPEKIEKQYFKYFFGGYRNADTSIAEKETEEHKERQKQEYNRRLDLDSINGLYIPKNIDECFIQLNKIMKEDDIETIKKYEDETKMYGLHMSVGMWLRNNWGLWGGSRLKVYFENRGVNHPDSMSSEILSNFYFWLKEQKDIGKKWEDENPIIYSGSNPKR